MTFLLYFLISLVFLDFLENFLNSFFQNLWIRKPLNPYVHDSVFIL